MTKLRKGYEMKKRKVRGVEVEMGSGNVFADLGLPDADKLKTRSRLAIEACKAVRRPRRGVSRPRCSE